MAEPTRFYTHTPAAAAAAAALAYAAPDGGGADGSSSSSSGRGVHVVRLLGRTFELRPPLPHHSPQQQQQQQRDRSGAPHPHCLLLFLRRALAAFVLLSMRAGAVSRNASLSPLPSPYLPGSGSAGSLPASPRAEVRSRSPVAGLAGTYERLTLAGSINDAPEDVLLLPQAQRHAQSHAQGQAADAEAEDAAAELHRRVLAIFWFTYRRGFAPIECALGCGCCCANAKKRMAGGKRGELAVKHPRRCWLFFCLWCFAFGSARFDFDISCSPT